MLAQALGNMPHALFQFEVAPVVIENPLQKRLLVEWSPGFFKRCRHLVEQFSGEEVFELKGLIVR
jgi:hypothetical protein